MQFEKRYRKGSVELRGDDKESRRITGIASVFYRDGDPSTQYELWPGVVERIMPGAFDEVLRTNPDVMGLFNHDPSQVLGRTSAGTLRLKVEPEGLFYEIDPSETSVYRNVVQWLDRGEVKGSSFAFYISPNGENWRKEGDNLEVREIVKVEALEDVGPVTYPAYQGTPTGVRGSDIIAEARASYDKWRIEIDREAARRDAVLRRAWLARR